jgi:hypothetical protein
MKEGSLNRVALPPLWAQILSAAAGVVKMKEIAFRSSRTCSEAGTDLVKYGKIGWGIPTETSRS